MNCKTMKHWLQKPNFVVSLLLGGAAALQSCSDDMLTGQPGWLGNSIYERLQEDGNYRMTLRLIDDLGQHDVMSQTGSKTLFVADDESFSQWFANNSWGVRSYEQLSEAQKKLLLNSSMVNNAYLIELLSSVSANPPSGANTPGKGLCMRRATALSIYDSVFVMKHEDMPDNPSWNYYRNNNKDIVLFKDATAMPMVHFLPAFMSHVKMTDNDLAILTNGEATSTADAWVSGKKVTERDITCKNGYIHKVDGVIEPLMNMADILRHNDEMSQWSKLVDRYSAPYYSESVTREYRRLYGDVDSVFVLRYLSRTSRTGTNDTRPDGTKVKEDAMLAFDPGWNEYVYNNTMGEDMHYDAGAMIVPTNEALNKWWTAGGGKALNEMYGSWENVPDGVLAELLNVNMLENFYDKLPSKFDNVLNDVKSPLGITPENVKRCFVGCNGVVYMVDSVYSPSSFSSVSYPALVRMDTDMKIMNWTITNLEFKPYLNSMDSRYSLFLPTDEALENYVDPINNGEARQTMLRFYYDDDEKTVKAERYACTVNADGTVERGIRLDPNVSSTIVRNRLQDIMDQLIIVGDVENGYKYYKSKGGTYLNIVDANNPASMRIAGGWQSERNTSVQVSRDYTYGNGKTYELKTQIPLGSAKSVYATLLEHPEYSEFLDLLRGGDPETPKQNLLIRSMGSTGQYTCANPTGNFNMRLFENYNYTVYIPTNGVIRGLINDGILPTWDDFNAYAAICDEENTSSSAAEKEEARKACQIIKDRIYNFVRYHIQDNSIIINGEPGKDENGAYIFANEYETMKQNPDNGRFYPLNVDISNNQITVRDNMGNVCHVNKTDGLYNNICREYWFSGSDNGRSIYMSSDAVVHQIDGALFFDNEQKTPWKNLLR